MQRSIFTKHDFYGKMLVGMSSKIINKKIFVGMSGGVDSAVSALLLKRDGYDVTGVFIKTWQPDYIECTWKNDRLDAMRVCSQLDIPFKTLDLEKEYKEKVIDYMLSEYAKNNTPNPDIMCNKYIKFNGFLNFARACGARIATGHYAKIVRDETGTYLVNTKDKSKDQTYFLYQIKKENMNDIIFPLSDLFKSEVKEIARKNNLYVAEKKESMGICMLGDISMKDFLAKELSPEKGNVCDQDNNVIGTHDGVILYTIGERHGFEINKKDSAENNNSLPYFVFEKDIKNNTLYVTQDKEKMLNENNTKIESCEEKIKKEKNSFILSDINCFVDIENLNETQKGELESKIYKAQTRYHGELYDIKLEIVNIKNNNKEKENNAQIKITPINNFSAVSGQSIVIYEGDMLILGGIF